MQCKNCEYSLETTNKFCANCGAKKIHNRLTIKSLWSDFFERFLNYDNTLLKTARHMFTKPEVVIDSFIQGTRKKYLNPFNFFLVSLAITGLYNFLYKSFLLEETIAFYQNSFKSFGQDELFSDNGFDGFTFFLEYFNLFAFASIPINAFVTKVTFWKNKKYNFTEHIVINLYTVSQYQLIIYTISIPLLFLSLEAQTTIGMLFFLCFIFYFFYVFVRLYKLNGIQLFKKLVTVFFIAIGFFILLLIITILGGFLYAAYNN
ncbi:DUF3667 domain-containing protein [Kordia sp. YSTF-M3]|uniref:DUF3667 domain-containing protein n=1 Tax=Kordia aestuariivivens TaxID=2759037 RepID=A0ABR7QDM0_9FLAO|nr:DUF3667 domain-containing protein [Kordia aestuariivivens]MBC8756518.1 DUF3667 domain-containing protein [Kordia aestuariivivens]